MTAHILDAHVKRLQAAGLSVDEAVLQLSELVKQVESKFAVQRDLKAVDAALEGIIQELEVNLRRHSEKMQVAAGRDLQSLEAVTQRDLHDLEVRLQSRLQVLEWITGQGNDR